MSKSQRRGGRLRGSAVLTLAAAFVCFACAAWSAESKPASNAVPKVLPDPAVKALASFRVKPGFRLDLVAAEPVVVAPIAMAFAENGRLFVVERASDVGGRGTNGPMGRVRLLEDPEGTGEYRTSTVYADNLPWASAVACYGGGVFVAAGADLIYLKDSRTNGIADVRKVVFSGLGGTNALTAQALLNNLHWGLDNRIHGVLAGPAGLVPGSIAPGSSLARLSAGDFSFDPRSLTMRAEPGPAESGLSFDNWGRRFMCDFTRPLRMQMFEPRYLARNPYFPRPPEMIEVASPATAVFRLTRVETPRRASAGAKSGATNGTAPTAVQMSNVLATAWLENAQGCVVYRGSAFAPGYVGDAFIPDPAAHIIHHAALRETELQVTAARAPDEARAEFVMSADPAFHPVQVVNGPDGALYIADRQEAGRGRIYRLVPTGFKPPKPPHFGGATTSALVAGLSNPNGWHRDTAARLLYERQDPAAVPLLTSLLQQSRSPVARLHALCALEGLGALRSWHLATGLGDPDEHVRAYSVRLSERLIQGGMLPEALWTQVRTLGADPSIRVRCQVALTVGEVRPPGRAAVLANVFWRNPDDLWLRAAISSSLAEGAGDLVLTLARDPRIRVNGAGQDFMLRLGTMIGVRNQPQEVAQVVGFLGQRGIALQPAFALCYALGDGLSQAGASLAQADPQGRLRRLYGMAQAGIVSSAGDVPLQAAGIRLLGVSSSTFADVGDLLLLSLGPNQPEAIQAAVLETLGRYDDPRIAPALLRRWSILPPDLRNAAVSALLARRSRIGAVLTALENGQIGRSDLTSEQADFLRTLHDPALSQRAIALFGPVPWRRPEAVEAFQPALSLAGNAARGRPIFLDRCAACHVPSGELQSVGPQLAGAKVLGKDKILTAILEPNAQVRPDYPTCVADTTQGEVLVGVLRDENEVTITVWPASGVPVVLPRASLASLEAQPWSLMPEGLEDGLTPQGMADLLADLLGPTATP
jgi:putative membrane-bound dehydrogenase-like protein